MSENRRKLPNFNSYEEAVEFFDTHSISDYWDEMEEVEMELSPALKEKLERKRFYRWLRLSEEQIQAIEQEAEEKRLSSRQLISQWILEHIQPVSTRI
ncbi:hypothetical protein FJZ31_39570 [Candidatus Poribacteria bacterium]|nr:hypothetical protein [Candidatus Poribacteria bacterium]